MAKSRVGIVVNPLSGKDVRRLVTQASIFTNEEKTNIISRLIMALDSVAVDEVLLSPDLYGIGERGRNRIEDSIGSCVSFVNVDPDGSPEDTLRATRVMRKEGVGCIITIGGDGTNRLVAKESNSIPIVPISTGTNNVFPFMVEATTAGLAAGLIATGSIRKEETSLRTKRCEVFVDKKMNDIALIDATITTGQFVGAGAIWDMSLVSEIVATQASSASIGMSAIAGGILNISQHEDSGIYVEIGKNGTKVLSPIAPGMLINVDVRSYQILGLGDSVSVKTSPCVIALDGERITEIDEGVPVDLSVTRKGPLRVDIDATLLKATERGFLRNRSGISAIR